MKVITIHTVGLNQVMIPPGEVFDCDPDAVEELLEKGAVEASSEPVSFRLPAQNAGKQAKPKPAAKPDVVDELLTPSPEPAA